MLTFDNKIKFLLILRLPWSKRASIYCSVWLATKKSFIKKICLNPNLFLFRFIKQVVLYLKPHPLLIKIICFSVSELYHFLLTFNHFQNFLFFKTKQFISSQQSNQIFLGFWYSKQIKSISISLMVNLLIKIQRNFPCIITVHIIITETQSL